MQSSASLDGTCACEFQLYELHTLGWQSIQDLCATVLREVWGQTVQSFADTQDGGRDGAFYGIWHGTAEDADVPEGPFVLQCKFLARRDDTLTLSTIEDELAKVRSLVERGLCNPRPYEQRPRHRHF